MPGRTGNWDVLTNAFDFLSRHIFKYVLGQNPNFGLGAFCLDLGVDTQRASSDDEFMRLRFVFACGRTYTAHLSVARHRLEVAIQLFLWRNTFFGERTSFSAIRSRSDTQCRRIRGSHNTIRAAAKFSRFRRAPSSRRPLFVHPNTLSCPHRQIFAISSHLVPRLRYY